MIESPTKGILAILDEKCLMVGSISDRDLLSHLDSTFARHAHYQSRGTAPQEKGLRREEDFRIRHFAGDVVYRVGGFIDKNRDTLFQDLKRLLFRSTDPVISGMWPEGAADVKDVTKRPITAGKAFKVRACKQHMHYSLTSLSRAGVHGGACARAVKQGALLCAVCQAE